MYFEPLSIYFLANLFRIHIQILFIIPVNSRDIYQNRVPNFLNSKFVVDFKKIPTFVVWFKKNSQFMVRFDRSDFFWGHFACGSGEMAPWNSLGPFRQSHRRNGQGISPVGLAKCLDRTKPNRSVWSITDSVWFNFGF